MDTVNTELNVFALHYGVIQVFVNIVGQLAVVLYIMCKVYTVFANIK